MGLEAGNYINNLDASNPLSSDAVSQGDDHLQLIKKTIKQSLPSVNQGSNPVIASASAPSLIVADDAVESGSKGSQGLVWYDTTTNTLKINKSTTGTADWVTLAISPITSNSVDINAGTIDGATIEDSIIGAATPAAGTFVALEGTAVKATSSLTLDTGVDMVFEGATADGFETTVTVTDPTADRTLTLPNATDTLVGKATTDTLTNKTMTSSGNTFDDATTSAKGMASFSSDNFAVSSGAVTIKDGGVANAELADMAANTVKVRDANSSGVPSDKALASGEILIGDGTGFTAAAPSSDISMTNAGVVTVEKLQNVAVSMTGLADNDILKYDSASSTFKPESDRIANHLTTKGDLLGYSDSEGRIPVGADGKVLTAASGEDFGLAWSDSTVADGAITNAKLADMGANTVKVRNANSSGVPSDLALATTEIMIGDGTGFTAAALSGDVTMTNAGAVTIADDAVTYAKLQNLAVANRVLGSASTGLIGEVQVATDMIADNAVTLAKMAGGTDGNLITFDASGDPAYVATGSANEVLTSNGAGAAPTFQAASGGSNTPSFGAYLNSNQALTDDTWTKLTMNTEEWDTDGAFDHSTNYRFTVPSGEGGKYFFSMTCTGTEDDGSGEDMGSIKLAIYKGASGATSSAFKQIWFDGAGARHEYRGLTLTAVLDLAATDIIEFYASMESNGTGTIEAIGGQSNTFCTGFKLL
jgi:hypothetical protein